MLPPEPVRHRARDGHPSGHPSGRAPGRVRLRLTLGAGVVLLLLGAVVAVASAAFAPHGATESVAPGTSDTSARGLSDSAAPLSDEGADASATSAPAGTLFVHILGEVRRPGLYELHQGDRAIDAVAAAGGTKKSADDTQLNLARFLTDGEQIIVPRKGDVAVGSGGAAGTGSGGAGVPGVAQKININTADEAALETLAGVGPALAQRIIDWREANGTFGSVDDLLNVTGIGDKTLDGFRDNVTV